MADPLSVASGVVGFVSLGIQVTQTLVDFYQAYKNLSSDVAATLSNLQALLAAFVPLENALKHRKFDATEIHLVERVETSLRECYELIQELQGECEKFRKESNGFKETIKSVGRRIAYPFRQSTLQKLNEDIGDIRSNLSFSIDVLQLNDSTKIQDSLANIGCQLRAVRENQVSGAIRSWLAGPDPSVNYNEACEKSQSGTGSWLLQHSLFIQWTSEVNSFLWLNGFAGCGKSVLSSTVISHLTRSSHAGKYCSVAYYYFTFVDQMKQDAPRAVSSLVLQLSHSKDLEDLYELNQAGVPSFSVLMNQLKRAISKLSNVFIVLDAIDESPRSKGRDKLLDTIDEIRSWGLPQLHLFITSRDEIDIRNSFEPRAHQQISMQNRSVRQDISIWISQRLKEDKTLRKWLPFRKKIEARLNERAKGVFRWVECQFVALRSCPRSEGHLDALLDSLPESLDETYERILRSIPRTSTRDARRILLMLSVARKPLSPQALIDAIAVDLEGSGRVDQNHKLQDVSDILEICVCLVDNFTDQGKGFVQIAHFSVLEYLQSDRIKEQEAATFALDHQACHLEITRICIIYVLDFYISKPSNGQQHHDSSLYNYTYSYWPFHYLESGAVGSPADSLVVRLLTNADYWHYVDWDDVAKNYEAPIRPLSIPYHSPIYTAIWLGLNHSLVPYRSTSLISKTSRIESPSSDDLSIEQDTPPALYTRFRLALALINTTESFPIGSVYPYGLKNVTTVVPDSEYHESPLQLASALGNKDMALELLDEGHDINDGRNLNRLTPLQAALGMEAMTRLLIREGADVNAYGLDGRTTALHLAVLSASKKMLQILLRGGAYVNIATRNMETPLALAIKWSSLEIVSLLLDEGADIELKDQMGQHALQIAAALGLPKVLEAIICKRGISRLQASEALDAAARAGQADSIEILLGMFSALKPENFAGAVVGAAAYGYPKILTRLFQEDVAIDAVADEDVGNALHAAAAAGHYDIVELLLEHGANVNARSGYFSTALIAATARGWEDVIQLLLSKGADANARNNKDENALQVAIYKGRRDIVDLLQGELQAPDVNDSSADWHRERAWELRAMTIPFGSDTATAAYSSVCRIHDHNFT